MAVPLAMLMTAAVAGLGISLYLLSVHWGWGQIVCLNIGACDVVNTSVYAELLGVPVALLGALTYGAIFATAVLIWRGLYVAAAQRAQFLLAGSGVAFSTYLTYIEIFVLRAICPWCVLSALLLTLITILGIQQWRQAGSTPCDPSRQKSASA
jgi:uncharacterized membrane protein